MRRNGFLLSLDALLSLLIAFVFATIIVLGLQADTSFSSSGDIAIPLLVDSLYKNGALHFVVGYNQTELDDFVGGLQVGSYCFNVSVYDGGTLLRSAQHDCAESMSVWSASSFIYDDGATYRVIVRGWLP